MYSQTRGVRNGYRPWNIRSLQCAVRRPLKHNPCHI